MQQGHTSLQRGAKETSFFQPPDGTPRKRQALNAAIRVVYSDSHCPVELKPVIQMKNEQWDVFLWVGIAEVAAKYACMHAILDPCIYIDWAINTYMH